MKKFYLFLSISIFLTACSGGTKNVTQSEFSLNGKFSDNSNDSKELFIQTYDPTSDKYISVDTIRIESGSFSYKNIISDNPEIRFIATENMPKPALIVVEKGSVEISFDSVYTPSIKGGDLNSKYQEYLSKRISFDEAMKNLSREAKEAEKNQRLTRELEAQIDAKYDSIYNETKKYTFNFAKDNIGNVVGQYILVDRGRSFDESQLGAILPLVDSKMKDDPRLAKIEKRYQALQATAVGQMFVDLKAKSPEGNDISLSEYAGKGKYTLIDFWASWCPPCRKEMPEVVSIYNKYKDKGFQIVGISLDKTNDDWKKGISELKITWPQISDLKYWQSDLSAAYAVNSIPHMVLLDKEGKIIARGITAHELSNKLAELLK